MQNVSQTCLTQITIRCLKKKREKKNVELMKRHDVSGFVQLIVIVI